ncbi:MAG: PAS domain-containing protein [Pirellulales bacterium]
MSRMDVTPSPEEFKIFFEKSPALCMAISPEFIILAASDEMLRATMTKREEIVGRPLFDVFPENPDRPDDDGVRNLRKSLARVLQSRKIDIMPVQKYDIRKPESEGGEFEVRYWSPVNAPILDAEGNIQYVMLRTEDVTEFVRLQKQSAEQTARFQELQSSGQQMELEVFLRTQEIKGLNLRLKQTNEELALDQG